MIKYNFKKHNLWEAIFPYGKEMIGISHMRFGKTNYNKKLMLCITSWLWNHTAWLQILALSLTSSGVTSYPWLTFFGFQFIK